MKANLYKILMYLTCFHNLVYFVQKYKPALSVLQLLHLRLKVSNLASKMLSHCHLPHLQQNWKMFHHILESCKLQNSLRQRIWLRPQSLTRETLWWCKKSEVKCHICDRDWHQCLRKCQSSIPQHFTPVAYNLNPRYGISLTRPDVVYYMQCWKITWPSTNFPDHRIWTPWHW